MVMVTWSMLCLRQLLDLSGSARPLVETHSLMSGRLLAKLAERLEGALRVGQRIAGAGDAEHGHLRDGAATAITFFTAWSG